ncbi:Thioesterase/thiol ester dehydrase-isomerase [Xylariaceae sp. FL0016]|nr:Thioesterase/thiol ester dehydrase-isomerase [Xylariaceae sp. FL0016]
MGSKSKSMIDALGDFQGIERVEKYLNFCADLYSDPERREWSSAVIPYLTVVSHSTSPPHPSVTFRFTVQSAHTNGLGNLHGGCTSTLFDIATTLPLLLISKPGYWWHLGVTRTLNVTCLRPVPVGSVVDIECEILQVGKRLCTLRGVMRSVVANGGKGPALTVCEHGKVSTDEPVAQL